MIMIMDVIMVMVMMGWDCIVLTPLASYKKNGKGLLQYLYLETVQFFAQIQNLIVIQFPAFNTQRLQGAVS